MRFSPLLANLPLATLATNAINVVQSNDDGWAEINIRQFFNSLTEAGFKSFISAPAENKSGRGSKDAEPSRIDSSGCEFGSCPAHSPPTGRNESMPLFNYVNSYPVTSMRYGIEKLSTELLGGRPDLAVAGPNVHSNLGLATHFSGTVGASVEAAKLGVPAIAFSGTTGTQTAWNSPLEPYVEIYADLSTTVTQALVCGGKPYLPDGIWLNVNFPAVDTTTCKSASDFKFVLSRIYPGIISGDDVETCDNSKRLPTENAVIDTPGCYASISVGMLDKTTADSEAQSAVLKSLKSILSCLPKND